MANELKFERETCSRCGGSGKHSFCEMYRDVCFKCGGSGQALTKRGAATAKWLRDLRMVRVDAVKIGQRISVPGYGKFNVVTAELDTRSSGKSLRDGVWHDSPPHYHLRGATMGYSTFPDALIEIVPSKAERIEQLKAAIEYQNTLTQAGKPRKAVAA